MLVPHLAASYLLFNVARALSVPLSVSESPRRPCLWVSASWLITDRQALVRMLLAEAQSGKHAVGRGSAGKTRDLPSAAERRLRQPGGEVASPAKGIARDDKGPAGSGPGDLARIACEMRSPGLTA